MKRELLLLLVALLPMVASSYDVQIDGIYYDFSGDNATVTYQKYQNDYYVSDYSGEVVIPESVTYGGKTYSVTSIGYRAFYGCSGLTSVTIPNSVTSIGEEAFRGCTSLTSVTIPNSVTSIGTSLTSITIGNSVTSIGYRAFSGCTSLTSVTIPNSMTSIGSQAFYGTGWYKAQPNGILYLDNWLIGYKETKPTGNVAINSGTRGIANAAFKDCSGLTAFDCCTSLTSITIGNSVTSIGYRAFSGCTSLTSVTIPNSVTSIGSCAFLDCKGLTSVTIPNSVTSIGGGAFSYCTSLTSMTIPNSVTSIGGEAFRGCTSLTSVTIPNSVTSIGSCAFQGCSSLTSITIPNSVTSIRDFAFSYCSSLTSITIPNSVTSIGSCAFYDCSGLTSVTIPNSVTSIGNYAFDGCSSLKKTIWLTNTPPSGYTNVKGTINYVSNEQYSGLSNTIIYPFLSSMFEVNGVCYVPVNPSERTCDPIDCRHNETAAHLNIASTVSYKGITMHVNKVQPYFCYKNPFVQTLNCDYEGEICNYAFSGCTNLYSLTLGKKVSSIGVCSFQGCSSLASVTIPDSVSTLGNYAFSGCSSLASVRLGNNIKSLGSYVFQNCGIPAISIPASVNSINNYAFSGCTKLKTIIIANRDNELSLGSNDSSPLFSDCPLDSVYIGGNINYNTSSSYGYSPFYRNTSLRMVVIADKETEVSPNEFYGCTNLQNFTIGDGVTSFGNWAFSGCTSLKRLSFGSHLASIGKEAFSDCSSVIEIVSKAVTPPSCGTQALDDINKWECTLTVPKGSLASYQQAEQWKEFFFINEGNGEEPPVIPDPEKCATPTISYVNGKLVFDSETEDVVFHSSITDTDIASYLNKEISLSATYTITVYATKAGYENSNVATATLCWIDAEPRSEGLEEDAVTEIKALPVLIQAQAGFINVQGLEAGTEVSAYNTSGMLLDTIVSGQDTATLRTKIPAGSTAIVKIGQRAIKVMVK